MTPPDLIRRRPDTVYGPSILDGERHARCVECKTLLEDDREAWFFGVTRRTLRKLEVLEQLDLRGLVRP